MAMGLGLGDSGRGRLHGIAVEDAGGMDGERQEDGAGGVGGKHDAPIAQHGACGDLAAGIGQHHQVVAREELAAGHHQHDEAEAERQSRDEPAKSEAQAIVGENEGGERAAEADIEAAQQAEQDQAPGRQGRAEDIGRFEPRGDLARRESIDRYRRFLLAVALVHDHPRSFSAAALGDCRCISRMGDFGGLSCSLGDTRPAAGAVSRARPPCAPGPATCSAAGRRCER